MTTTTANDDVTADNGMDVLEMGAPAPGYSAGTAPTHATRNNAIKHNQVAPYNDVSSYGGTGPPAQTSGVDYSQAFGQAASTPQFDGGAATQPNIFLMNQPVSTRTCIYYGNKCLQMKSAFQI